MFLMVAVSGKYEEYRESRVIVFDRDQQLQMEMAKHKQQFVGGQYGYADPTWDCAAAAHSLGLFVCRGVDDSESHEYHTAGPLPITINGNVPQFHVRFVNILSTAVPRWQPQVWRLWGVSRRCRAVGEC